MDEGRANLQYRSLAQWCAAFCWDRAELCPGRSICRDPSHSDPCAHPFTLHVQN